MTQQNAALVEQSTAAAQSLREQAGQLAQAVSVFKVDTSGMALAAPVAYRAEATVPAPVRKAVPPAKPAVRVPAQAPARLAQSVAAAPAKPAAPAKTLAAAPRVGGEDDWESF
jgi:hypothetical protein